MTDTLPKIELHLHLEGAAPPAFIRGLAAEKKMDIVPGVFDARGDYSYTDFWHFLKVYEAATETLRTPRDYYRLTRAVLEESAASGPPIPKPSCRPISAAVATSRLAGIPARDPRGGGGGRAAGRHHVARHRHADPPLRAREGEGNGDLRGRDGGDWIVGFGLAGDEKAGKPRDFAWAFDAAREAGLRLTCHAGEWGGPDSVRDAIRDLGVERIGHGVRAIEDLALVDELPSAAPRFWYSAPGSNIALGLYPGWRQHPIGQLFDRGVKVTVSTDDPPFFHHTTMVRE